MKAIGGILIAGCFTLAPEILRAIIVIIVMPILARKKSQIIWALNFTWALNFGAS